MGANGSDEVLNHAFFQDIDLNKLLAKQLKPPFLPKTTDPDMMRQSSENVVRLRDLRESVPDAEKANMIQGVNQHLFENFGTDID